MKYLFFLVFLGLINRRFHCIPLISSFYFSKEPENAYLVESSSLNEIKPLLVECAIESAENSNKVKWLKDEVEFDESQTYIWSNYELKGELLSNGSLKLSFKLINNSKTANLEFKLELIASFKCVASSSFGKIVSRVSKVFKLNDASSEDGLKFIKQPENTTLYLGKRLVLKCKPNLTSQLRTLNLNSSQIQYKWLKDGKQIIYSSKMILYKDGTLEIPQVNENDSGAYKCTARFRSYMLESRSAIVKVISSPLSTSTSSVERKIKKTTPIFMAWPEDQSLQESDEAIMECMAMNDALYLTDFNSSFILRSKPQFFSYKWLKDGVALDLKIKDKTKRMQLIRGSSLRIEKLEESDSATYTCRICNANQEEESSEFTSLNRKTSDYDSKFNNTRLDISSLERDECDERSGVLKVLVPPRFLKRPLNINATLKSDVEFECNVYGVPKPSVQWFKNGEPIYPSEYFQFSQSNLKILGIIAQDEGYYQCLATNELNTIQSVAQLTVITDDYSVNENSENDYENEYTTKNDKKISKQQLQHLKQSNSQSVQLSAPVNLTLTNKKARSFQIDWKPPSVIRSSKLDAASANSVNNSLYYAVSWKAKNTDRQRELNTTQTSMLIDEATANTVYIIQICAVLDTIKGPCSDIEVATDQEMLMPGPPVDFKAEFIDLNSQLQTLTTTLRFKWKKPVANPGNIVKYRLYYQHLHYGPLVVNLDTNKKSTDYEYSSAEPNENSDNLADSGEYDGEKVKSSSEKYLDIDIPHLESPENFYEFLLEDLLKYSTYRFSLVAVNKEMITDLENSSNEKLKSETDLNENVYNTNPETVDKSSRHNMKLNSADLFIETPSDVPDGPPENLQIETINTTSVLFQWDMPALEKRNGMIIGYKISIKENDKQIWHSNEDSEPRKKIINGLLPFHKYSVRVTARTQNGSGPASDWIIAETFTHEMDESRVPGQPVDMFTEPTDKSIVIRWLSPSDSNKTLVRRYLLKYGIGYPITEVQIPGTRNSYIINELIPSSQYVISLRAANNAGYGMELLKDVITKRKYALGENEKLFPPLNVQGVAISPQSIELSWTDWHLKPEESIPDDRHYMVRYNIADLSNAKYKHKNSTERKLILSDLKPNTLYDFSVRLVIGSRESDWSMTSSQMTMESTPAPRDLVIKSDPNTPTSVIITWQALNYSSTTDKNDQLNYFSFQTQGYVISYLDETRLKENPNNKWKHEYVTANENQKTIESTIKKLKTDTTYYFKIQARNNRAYGASSPTIIFKTPNEKGEGGGQIFTPGNNEVQQQDDSSESTAIIAKNRKYFEINLVFVVVIASGSIFLGLFIIFFGVVCCKKNGKKSKLKEFNGKQKNLNKNYLEELPINSNHTDDLNNNNNNNNDDSEPNTFHKHSNQHHLLLNCHSNGNNHTPNSLHQQHMHSNASNTSSLRRQQQQQQQHYQPHRTPSHNSSALVINNPNHMMMNLMNPLSINNNSSNNNPEFYSNVSQQLLTSNSRTNSDTADSCYQFNQSYNNYQQQQQQNYGHHNLRTSSLNEENCILSQSDDLNKDFTTSAAIAAANAAFNAPINVGSTNINATESLFLRHPIRPKPVAIPLNTTPTLSETNSTSPLINSNENHMFTSNANTRKSFKNLPIATATLIASSSTSQSSSSNHPLSFNFNDFTASKQQALNGSNGNSYFVNQANSQKIHYTARPYIIDNQVQSNLDYSNHSPASSCHSSGQAQVYDKIGNCTTSTVGSAVVASTKSLLQPLKSFGSNANQTANLTLCNPSSSISIPNTPAKYCENYANMSRSPAKKQLLVSLGSSNTHTQTAVSRCNNFSTQLSNDIGMMGKSFENVYEKKFLDTSCNSDQELTAEMANLEGIMKDLNAITAHQFEC